MRSLNRLTIYNTLNCHLTIIHSLKRQTLEAENNCQKDQEKIVENCNVTVFVL